MGDAPSCSTCGAIMVRNGSCYRCMSVDRRAVAVRTETVWIGGFPGLKRETWGTHSWKLITQSLGRGTRRQLGSPRDSPVTLIGG